MESQTCEIEIQEDILTFWKDNNIHQRSVTQNKRYAKLTMYDGPPFPTGPPHHGHMMTSSVKDTVARYLMATGHYVPRTLGWDMYGPNVSDKSVEHIHTWNETLRYLGRWVDNEGYRTSSDSYKESVWWVFKSLWTKNHVQFSQGITPYCRSCGLYYSDFERHQQQVSVVEKSIYFYADSQTSIEKFLIWEMRPWTLIHIVGYAISTDDAYVINEQNIIMSKHAINTLGSKVCGPWKPWRRDVTITYQAYDSYKDKYVPIYFSDTVDSSKGTGIMALSPYLNDRSAKICNELSIISAIYDIPIVYNDNVIDLMGDLVIATRDIARQESACPKCRNRLIMYPINGIYYMIDDNRSEIIDTLDSIYWEPKESKDKIIHYAKHIKDWLISRDKPIGIPIPIWRNFKGEHLVLGSYAELKEKVVDWNCNPGSYLPNFGEWTWCNLYFDNWFDSACMPYGSVGYPFNTTKMELVSSLFPCLLAIEGVDQLHGWFFTTNVISSSLFNKAAFINIITNGLVLDKGIKMSKSDRGTQRSVLSTIKQYGADTYRIYMMQNRLLSGIDFDFNHEKISGSFTKSLLGIYQYIDRSCTNHSVNILFKATRITNITDNWLLQSLDDYLYEYHQLMLVFKVARALSLATGFLSHIRKYIHFNRARLSRSDTISTSVLIRTLYYFIMTTAPFAPFISEHIYQKMRKWGNFHEISVHHCQIPKKQWRVNKDFLESSTMMFKIIDLLGKVTSNKVRVHIHDITLLRGVDGYIQEVTGKNIMYSNGLSKVLSGSIDIRSKNMFSEADQQIFDKMTLTDVIELDKKGYYRNSMGNTTYPGQYVITYIPKITSSDTYCSGGVLVHGIPMNDVDPINDHELIIKGQLIGRKLINFMKKNNECGKSMVYIEHPALTDIVDPKIKVLLANLNRYTLPIISQSIYPYREDLSSFAQLPIKLGDITVVFYLTTINLNESE